MKFPKDVFQLQQIIEEFSKRNEDTPICFMATDREKIPHLITNHPTEIFSMMNAIPSDIGMMFKDVI